jgi:hypothetical protein
MKSRPTGLMALTALTILAAGCGGSGGGSGGGGGGGGAPPPGGDPYDPNPPSLEASFSSIQANVFTPACTSCHIGALAPEGLMLDSANSYGLLVDVESSQVEDLLRVDPGNPDDSYLIHKLQGTAAVGERMPLGGPPLAPAAIETIRQWILNGAIDDRATGVSAKPLRASGASIVPNSVVEALPGTIIVMFDQELDFSTVQPQVVKLSRSGGNGVFDDDSEIVLPVSSVGASMVNPRALTIRLDGVPSVPDSYRLVIFGTGHNPLQDIAGFRLDGNLVQSFPSGDGVEGGDLSIEFTVGGSAQ